ncbi:S66 peptidase family protein [Frigoriflavimonas asaccharolytica]|uniref:Muramoyltetrapeptide carboxypeptidase n=1 Tax=Frigoriflavimonas asaccharolytica TaxID=2735899 RepID=A0A8J8G5N1_9FLAO|nr:LD-carboxypeptidase [Frigoriflavimonas asaccharolytica]NRS91190.1 muramoyltetrapeptide carboxypeptidase [Frigoriflavimonas asaccharolytica]
MSKIIFPKSIYKGGNIAIIAPAGSVGKDQLQSTLDLLVTNGYNPILGKHLFGKYQFGYEYSGTEKERIEDLNWAFNDDKIGAIWAARGGYGCQHLIKKLDLKKQIKNPKWYIGYSDNTVIHSYLLKKGIASINGQTIKTSSFGVSDQSYNEIFKILNGTSPKYLVEESQFNKKGKADGQLVGGNLALIYALLGTKDSFKWKDKILFIEEIGENFYALDRMLMSLEMAGVFKKIKGLIVGGMINMGKEESNKNFNESFDQFANEIIAERIKKYQFPTLFRFPNGHIFENRPLIIGANVQLTVGKENSVFYI